MKRDSICVGWKDLDLCGNDSAETVIDEAGRFVVVVKCKHSKIL